MRTAIFLLLLLATLPAAVALPSAHPSSVRYVGGASLPQGEPGVSCQDAATDPPVVALGGCFLALPASKNFTIAVKDVLVTRISFRWIVEVPQEGLTPYSPVICASGDADGSVTLPVPDCPGGTVSVFLGTFATTGTITVSEAP